MSEILSSLQKDKILTQQIESRIKKKCHLLPFLLYPPVPKGSLFSLSKRSKFFTVAYGSNKYVMKNYSLTPNPDF